MQSFQIGENQAGQRLDKFLHKFMPVAGNGFLYKMLRKKNIVLNGKKAEGKEILAVGDTVSFFFSEETFRHFTGEDGGTESGSALQGHTKEGSAFPQNKITLYQEAYASLKGISILYEDKHILVVNKPAGMLTQRDDSGKPSLNEWVIGYLLCHGRLSEDTLKTFRPSVQNRLDYNTSGIVLCGISLSGSQMLSELIRSRKLGKYYVTVVQGKIGEAGALSGFLSKDEKRNQVQISGETGREINTTYRPLVTEDDFTCLEVKLITGRPHQIRAHMASIGHPVMGDRKYGDAAFNAVCRNKYGVQCQLLHAARIEFPMLSGGFSDLSGKVFTVPLPAVFKEVYRHGNMEFQRIERLYAGGTDKQNQ